MDELDRLAAVMQHESFIAKYFPGTWYMLQQREEQKEQMAPSLKEQVAAKIKHNEDKKKYGIKNRVTTKKDIHEILIRVEDLLKEQKK